MLFNPNKIIPSILLVTLITAVGCESKKTDASKQKGAGAPKVLKAEGFLVNYQTYSTTYTASGSLLPNEVIDIHAEIAGRVTGIYFTEGGNVSKGQKLVQLYDADIRAQIQKLLALRALQVKTLKRQEDLLAIGGISRQDYETTQTQIRSLDADIAFQQASLQKTKIIAPFSGKIGIRNISPGAVITTGTVIANLQQTNPLKMDFTIPDQYRANIRDGEIVQFNVDGTLDTLSGRISAIDPGADPVTRTIKVRAIVANPRGTLVAGSFAHVRIPFKTDDRAILIPSEAVIPTTRDKKVAITNGGKAELRTVIVGDRTTDRAQILQGLEPGDTVITTGLMQVKNDMEVKITRMR